MTQYRARFDAEVSFTNGGDLAARGFMLDIAGPTISQERLATLFVESLDLLMAGPVTVRNIEIVEAPHKGSRGGPIAVKHVDLSHVIEAGMTTYPGLPVPTITPYLTRAQSRARYAPGTEFALDCISLIGNTGTYLDSPYHRYEGGTDLAGLSLANLCDLPTMVIDARGSSRGTDATALATALGSTGVAGAAVLIHTGGDTRFGTPEYALDAGYLTRDGADWLVRNGAALVGIDSVNIDDVDDGSRPAHSVLLAAGIPIVEHMTGLEQLPAAGARFTAVPPRVADFGTFPVRAFATVPVRSQ